jgi:hypothetical protein
MAPHTPANHKTSDGNALIAGARQRLTQALFVAGLRERLGRAGAYALDALSGRSRLDVDRGTRVLPFCAFKGLKQVLRAAPGPVAS